MSPERIKDLLQQIKDGKISVEEGVASLKALPFEDLGFATLDHHRSLRQGFPEVVFCEGKSIDQIVEICSRISGAGVTMLATRADQEAREALKGAFSEAEVNEVGRTVLVRSKESLPKPTGTVLVISAGTSDLPVAEEAAVTADAMGNRVERLYDVGVAGIHRLLAHREALSLANVIVVVAGMEGALPSVVGGLVDVPVIAVPTSVGYGASFGGIAALLGMLNSCAAGVTVVNIDNGFGAGMAASAINRVRKSGGSGKEQNAK